jgi:hypothetical protein
MDFLSNLNENYNHIPISDDGNYQNKVDVGHCISQRFCFVFYSLIVLSGKASYSDKG